MNIIKKLYKDINSTKKGTAMFSAAIGVPTLFMAETTESTLGIAFIVSWFVFTAITLCEVEKASFITDEQYS